MQQLQRLLLLLFCSAPFVSTATAVAMAPPEPSLRKVPAAWVGFGLIFIFFIVVVVINLMSSKRGHQD
ncbi:MAG: hypothetical protein H8E86_01430 [Planctomycetes bacterium]|nr:hypothetical protein [Planctomycetota bacterium]